MFKRIPILFIYLTIAGFISCNTKENQSLINDIVNTNDELVITMDQAKKIGLEFGKLKYMNLSNSINANGYLETPPQNQAKISSNVLGKVVKVNFLIGDYVKKGNEVIQIESIEFLEIQKNYISIKGALKFLEDDYQRQKQLSEQNVNAKKVFYQAERDYISAKAEFELISKKLEILQANKQEIEKGSISPYLSIRSPINGYVSELYSVIGEFIDEEDILIEIINLEHLHAELNVYESDILKIKIGQKARISIPQNKDLNMIGEVFLIGKNMDEESRSVDIHVHIPNNDKLLVGMYIEGKIILDPQNVIAIPEEGLIREEDASYIYILSHQTENEYHLKKEFVNPGIESDGLVAIEFSEEADTSRMVATKGIYYLSSNTN